MCCPRDADANNSWLQRREESQQALGVENYCAEEPRFSVVQLIMAELSMQTPNKCIPSQLSGASSKLPLTDSDATLSRSQSLHPVRSSSIANDALAVPLLPAIPLHSLLSLPPACLFYPSPIFHCLRDVILFWTGAWKIQGFPVKVQEGALCTTSPSPYSGSPCSSGSPCPLSRRSVSCL